MPFPDTIQTPPPPVLPDPYSFPSRFIAGDTFIYRVQNGSIYPSSDGWSFQVSMRGGGSTIDLTSVIDSGDFLITATAGTTAGWAPGEYQFQVFAVNGGKRSVILDGFIDIVVNLPGKCATQDVRSHAQRCLDLIEALLEGRAQDDIIASQVDLTHFTRMNFTELTAAHSYYTAKVRSETAKARARNGLPTGRNVLARFVTPF